MQLGKILSTNSKFILTSLITAAVLGIASVEYLKKWTNDKKKVAPEGATPAEQVSVQAENEVWQTLHDLSKNKAFLRLVVLAKVSVVLICVLVALYFKHN